MPSQLGDSFPIAVSLFLPSNSEMQFNLTRDQILEYAERYVYDADDVLGSRMEAAAQRGYMRRNDLIEVASWKWRGGRTRQLCGQNTESEVEEITRASFAAKSERLRIGALLSLRGVQWPMASVILHFAFPDRYPILDVRAMNTVGGSTHYTFEKWQVYLEMCQAEAKSHGITMRTLDKALWAFDKGTP
ncbi:hypothetical protein [Leisingera sp. D0M16]|uniref:hypothetical protein n=1 Tax=Leisingera coralii TaxID=3351347 RepID=UPI003BA2D60F